ncbi:YhjD/YihY/BrkB family envelope integrity protein [Streptomyces sp. ICBB 8177]|uniref:YhjD/YihY/BrkB family envelope integrity protein n=1 Tax=Streptomyces sp. ICBB 8177 TaxID=563922 RepID=UPI001F547A24|nr:YhjD/YihY/BrkB family envelope integrity protein [Streptomyces sp. ICBB 8177]
MEDGKRAVGRRLRTASGLWNRLSAIDFFGHSFQLAALAILCFFPFLIVVAAATGRDTAASVVGWLGLDQRAAQAVTTLFKPGATPGTLTLTSACLLVLGAMAVAGTLQSWYQTVFGVPRRGWHDLAACLYWLGALLAYSAAQTFAGRTIGTVGGPVWQGLFGFALATFFWWWSMKLLLSGAVRWRTLFPAALATGVCWVGLGGFSAHYFSATIVANEQSYGPIGVVMVILSWLVAVGVVVHLGSVVGCLYLEHRSRTAS